MTTYFSQSLLNQTILSQDQSFNNTTLTGTTTVNNSAVFNLTSLSGLADNSSIQETTGVLSVKNNGITSNMLQSNSVTTAKIADANVSDAKIISVSGSKIIGSITGNALVNNAISSTGASFGVVVDTSALTASKIITFRDLAGTVAFLSDITAGGSSFADNVFTIYDNVTPTKIANFECSSLPVGTTTFTFPNASGILATTSTTQTFQNKTLIDGLTKIAWIGDNTSTMTFDCSLIPTGTNRQLTVQNLNGTIALTSDLANYVTLTTVQSVTNKSFQDSTTKFYDNLDATKTAQFNCDAIASGQNRVINIPNATGTLLLENLAQFCTLKDIQNCSFQDNSNYFYDDFVTTKKMFFDCSLITAATSRTLQCPDLSGVICTTAGVQTITDKQIVLPINTTTTPAIKLTGGGSFKTTPVNGDLEYVDTALYFTNGTASRGVIPMYWMTFASASVALASVTTAQNVFAAAKDSIALPTSSTYFVEWAYYLQTGVVSHTTAIGWTYSGTVTSFEWDCTNWSSAANTLTTTQTTIQGSGIASRVINAASILANTIIKGSGVLNVSTAGNFVPQLTFSVAPTGTNLTLTGSYCRITPLSSATLNFVGPWS